MLVASIAATHRAEHVACLHHHYLFWYFCDVPEHYRNLEPFGMTTHPTKKGVARGPWLSNGALTNTVHRQNAHSVLS